MPTLSRISPRARLLATPALAATLIPAAASAQDVVQLPTVRVEAEVHEHHHPAAGSIVTGETLRDYAASSSDTADVLTRLPGVSANAGGGFSSMPAIRGLSEQRIRVLVDGQPIDMACPNDMNSPLSYTNPQTIAAISVIPGVAPVSYGGDNIGGVISVSSAEPRFANGGGTLVTGNVSSYYRSNGNAFGGSASVTVAGDHLSATYTGSYNQSENYEGGGNRGEVRSTEYAKTDHALALALQNSAGLFELKGGFQFSPYEAFPNQSMDMTDNRSWFVQGRYRGDFTWGNVDLSASYRDTDHEMNFLEDKLPGSMPMNTEVHTFASAAKFEIPLASTQTARFGAEYHHQWLDDYWPPVPGVMMMGPDTFVNINAAHRDRIGGYAEWDAQWTGSLSTILGIRYDRVSMNTGDVRPYGTDMMQMADVMAAAAFNAIDRKRTDHNWSASALVSWNPSDEVTLELGYAHKARSPNIYERYSWGRGAMASRMIGWYGDGNGYFGDPDLKPERADTVSATAIFAPTPGISFKVSPYYTRVDDYIDAVYVQNLNDMMGMPSGFVQLRFANLDAEFYGIDASLDAHLAGTPRHGTALTATFSWLRGTNITEDLPLYRQMPLNGTVALTHRTETIELGGEIEWTDRKDRIDPRRNEPVTAGYVLVNLSAAYNLSGWRLALEANNLFDKGYDLPLGGVSLGDFGVTGELRPVPGRGRSFNLAVSRSF
jgi:iron complex outermembrane recepter protein